MAQKAQVLVPIPITAAMVTASAVAEPAAGETAWNAATNYSIGTQVIRTTTHRKYTALVAGVDAGLPEATPLRWFDAGPTNRMAAFDNYRSTATLYAGTLTMTVKPGIITGMQFFGLQGDSLRVVIKNATSLVTYYDATTSLSLYLTGDLMWNFYYGTPTQQDGLRISGLVPQDAQIEITLTPSAVTGNAAIGILAVGTFNDIGFPEYGFKAQPVSYDRITVDAYGATVITKGLAAKNLVGECVIPIADVTGVTDTIYQLLGVPCAWVISSANNYDYLSAFGLGTADVTAQGPQHAKLSLNVRGLI